MRKAFNIYVKNLNGKELKCTRAIWKVTSGELLTKPAVRNSCVVYRKYVHN
jgi:hypothetical protein